MLTLFVILLLCWLECWQ